MNQGLRYCQVAFSKRIMATPINQRSNTMATLEVMHKVGKRVKFEGRAISGAGKITEVKTTERGVRVYVESKDHPKGGLWLHQTKVRGY